VSDAHDAYKPSVLVNSNKDAVGDPDIPGAQPLELSSQLLGGTAIDRSPPQLKDMRTQSPTFKPFPSELQPDTSLG